MIKNTIKDFCIDFFKTLDCKIISKKNMITIENAPYEFEDFVGKNAPYNLTFDTESHNDIENSELMVKGSYLLKSMRDFMQDKAQTTLLKLKIEIKDPSKEIEKELKFNNCKIINISKKKKNSFLARFIFLSTSQYLNEKEQAICPILIGNKQVINNDLNDYNIQDGNKEDVNEIDVFDSYDIAKNELKQNLSKTHKEIEKRLKTKLAKEIYRLKSHYQNQRKEKDEELENTEQKLEMAKNQFKRAYYEDEKIKLKSKIDRLNENIENLKKDNYLMRMQKEEDFHIQDETFKHSLNISNKLINVSVIYYPTYCFDINLKNLSTEKKIELSYNPLLKKIDMPVCESCKTETKEINLCSKSHITCNKCLNKCSSCKKEFCESCLKYSCSKCNAKLCEDCSKKCLICDKYYCSNHIKKCSICDKESCVNCLEKCDDCNKLSCKEHFKKCPNCSRKTCEKCAKKDFVKCLECSKIVCNKCLDKCNICSKTLCENHIKKCSSCKSIVCEEHSKKCSVCKKIFCDKCIRKCKGCGKIVCKDDLSECKKCGTKICKNCIRIKKRVFGFIKIQRCIKCEDK